MTTDDLKRYSAPERAPIARQYRGLTVYGMGPPSRGGTTVAEALNILGGYTPAGATRTQVAAPLPGGVALRLRRPQRLPRRPGVLRRPGRRADVDLVRRRAPRADHRHGGQEPRRRRRSLRQPGQASKAAADSGVDLAPRQSTTHLTTADSKGNVVSYTFTIESTGGNAVVVPGYGFLLNNELTDFNYDSTTHPNRVEGSKRPRSSMSPTIIDRDGKPYLADRLAGRLDDHRHRAADDRQPDRPAGAAAERHRAAARRRAQHRERAGRAGVHRLPGGPRPRRHLRTHEVHPAAGAGRDRRRDGRSRSAASASSPRPSRSAAARARRASSRRSEGARPGPVSGPGRRVRGDVSDPTA